MKTQKGPVPGEIANLREIITELLKKFLKYTRCIPGSCMGVPGTVQGVSMSFRAITGVFVVLQKRCRMCQWIAGVYRVPKDVPGRCRGIPRGFQDCFTIFCRVSEAFLGWSRRFQMVKEHTGTPGIAGMFRAGSRSIPEGFNVFQGRYVSRNFRNALGIFKGLRNF